MTVLRRLPRMVAAVVLLAGCQDVLNDIPDAKVATVSVTPDSTDLVTGTGMVVKAYPLDDTGALRPGLAVQWSSADPSIATVDDTGGVVGLSPGTATITATIAGKTGTARVRVGAAPLLGLSRTAITFNAQAGQTSPSPDTLTVFNAGGLSLNGIAIGTILYGGGQQNWLFSSLSATSANSILTLTPASAGIFVAGTYTATVPVQALAGNAPQNVTVTLVVAPGPPAARVMTVVTGDAQTVVAGSQVPVSPAVAVADTFGNPVAGLPVTFQVLSGGGTVTGGALSSTVNTNGLGVATLGTWTPGTAGTVPANGFFNNTLAVTAAAAAGLSFSADAYYNYTTHVHPLWAANGCLGCHGSAPGTANLNLSGTAATVYGTELFSVATSCAFGGGVVQVASGGGVAAEANSLLMIKLDHLPSLTGSPCALGMPTGGPLPAAVRDIVRAWIRAGAPL